MRLLLAALLLALAILALLWRRSLPAPEPEWPLRLRVAALIHGARAVDALSGRQRHPMTLGDLRARGLLDDMPLLPPDPYLDDLYAKEGYVRWSRS